MRNSYILVATAVLFVLASCNKTLKVDSVSLNVTTSSTSYNAGDSVNFMFTGQPDMITFYSGEPGHNYLYRDRIVAEGQPQMQFTSYAQYGTMDSTQDSTLQLLVSTNFNGKYDSADIYQATWTDITSMATLSTGSNNTPTGVINLSQYVPQGDSLYFAFRFTDSTNSTPLTWTIQNFGINLLEADSASSAVANIVSAGWKAITLEGTSVWKISSTQLQIVGGTGTAPANEAWLITASLYPYIVTPDQGVAIKNITQKLPQFSYIYTTPGSYNASFVATSATADGVKTLVKNVGLTIK